MFLGMNTMHTILGSMAFDQLDIEKLVGFKKTLMDFGNVGDSF